MRSPKQDWSGASARVNFSVTRKWSDGPDDILKRFKKASHSHDGQITYEASRRSHYEKPSAIRHRQEKKAEFWQGVRTSHEPD